MKKQYFLAFSFYLIFSSLGWSQSSELGALVQTGGQNINRYGAAYLRPANNVLGIILNNGWYNTAEVLKPGRFEIRLVASGAVAASEDLTFDLRSIGLSNDVQILDQNTITPTILGQDNPGPAIQKIFAPPLVDTLQTVNFNAPQGLGLNLLALPQLQVSLGLPIKGLEGTLRFIPPLSYDFSGATASLGIYGLGVKWDFQRLVPRMNLWPVHFALAANATYMGLITSLDVQPANLPNASTNLLQANQYQDQQLAFETVAYGFSLLMSKKLPGVTFFTALRYDAATTSLNLKGNYPFTSIETSRTDTDFQRQVVDVARNPISFSTNFQQIGINGGMRIKLGFFTLNFDATYGSKGYHSFSVGLGFGRYN